MTFSEVKIYEAMEAVLHGADELDIVMNLGFAKSNDWGKVKKDVSDIITATPEAVHKVIIETCYLTDDEKKKASLMVMNAGANYIKTSTGFATAGAVVKDVEIITSITKREIGIKAAGGIKTLEDLTAFIDAGATRIGTSSGVAIMEEVDNLLKRIQGIQESKH
jgi:deoxyribose-phosphate aldolase